MAGRYDFTLDQGSTVTRDFIYKDADGIVIPLTDFTARMMIRKTHNASGDPLFDSDDHAGSITVTAPEGKVTMVLNSAVTGVLPAPAELVYDIEINDTTATPGEGVDRLIEGRIVTTPQVTR